MTATLRRRTLVRTLLGLVAAAALAGVAGLAWSLQQPYAGWEGPSVLVRLPKGSSAGAMIDALAREGVVQRPRVLRLWIRMAGTGDRLQAGTYRFERPLSPLEVLRKVQAGDVALQPVTIPEGLVLEEIAARLSQAGFGSVEAFLSRFRDPSGIADLDPGATDLEGYLFPDTYHFPVDETPEGIVAALLRRFRAVADPAYRAAAAAAGLSLHQAVTLASLIERETSLPEERPRISRVFHNRLAQRMRLDCDPTVVYGLRRAGVDVPRLLTRHLRIDTPWNTYVRTGLPVGPICSPGRASLEAAVRPAEGDELYFVAAPGGGHRFSRDLAAHSRAVAAWRAHMAAQ